jgi:predicted RNase H-like HicB family nuclease
LRYRLTEQATYRAALEEAQRAIDEWIGTARELGREIPKPRGCLLLA